MVLFLSCGVCTNSPGQLFRIISAKRTAPGPQDGVKNPDTQPQDLIRHLDHLIGRLGEKGVALGSDFDGAMMPEFIGDASGLPRLIAAMQAAGYGDTLIRRLCWDNWLDLLRRVIG